MYDPKQHETYWWNLGWEDCRDGKPYNTKSVPPQFHTKYADGYNIAQTEYMS